jgi:mono/diheme cytochrome c family protein
MNRWLCGLLLAFTVRAADKPAPPWEKSSEVSLAGQNLFRENCAVCHDIDKDIRGSRKIGPSLRHLFKNPKLPLSKGKPSRAYVIVRVQYGGPVMPAFRTRIDNAQMDALLAYLEGK